MAGNLDIALKSSRLDSCKPNAVNLTKQSDIKNYNRFQENQRTISGFVCSVTNSKHPEL